MKVLNATPFPEPRFSKPVFHLSRMIIRPYLHFAMGVKGITTVHREHLREALSSPYPVIIAFRHTAKEDAPVLLAAIKESHVRFIYGRDVLYWAGRATQFLFPRLGFIAVQNRSANKEGMQYLRKELARPRYPLALAPEGQVTYHMHQVSKLQSGIASMALWAMESAGGVTILPLSIGYRYANANEDWVSSLLERWEHLSGLTVEGDTLVEQIINAMESMLCEIARAYSLEDNPHYSFTQRRDMICEGLLSLAEAEAGLQDAQGSIIDRLYRVRFTGSDTLFIRDSSFEEKENAKRYLVKNQIVDLLEYLDPAYLQGKYQTGRAAESALNLLDLVNRMQGGTIDTRFSPRGKQAYLKMGKPLYYKAESLSTLGRKSQQKQILLNVCDALQACSEELEHMLM
nr:1-acyl-sn-glycerol-3-phosphate acyltransferase [uncultured Sphaerochaeta sp.]